MRLSQAVSLDMCTFSTLDPPAPYLRKWFVFPPALPLPILPSQWKEQVTVTLVLAEWLSWCNTGILKTKRSLFLSLPCNDLGCKGCWATCFMTSFGERGSFHLIILPPLKVCISSSPWSKSDSAHIHVPDHRLEKKFKQVIPFKQVRQKLLRTFPLTSF